MSKDSSLDARAEAESLQPGEWGGFQNPGSSLNLNVYIAVYSHVSQVDQSAENLCCESFLQCRCIHQYKYGVAQNCVCVARAEISGFWNHS